MPLAISRSKPFRLLQSRIGHATYRLNTIFVGLDCVARGMGDGGAIAVTWRKPSQEQAKPVSDQARIFVCAGALTLAFDVVDSFLRDIAREQWLGFSEVTRGVATKSATGPGGHEYSVSERFAALYGELGENDELRIAAFELFARWRNAVVHGEDRASSLTASSRRTLLGARSEFHDKYSHLDIGMAIDNFEAKRVPVPKEVTSLIAIVVNACRALDEAAIRRVVPSSDAMELAVDALLRAHFNRPQHGVSGVWASFASSWGSNQQRRQALMEKVLANIGVTPSLCPVSPELPPSWLTEIVGLDVIEIAKRFEVNCEPVMT